MPKQYACYCDLHVKGPLKRFTNQFDNWVFSSYNKTKKVKGKKKKT